MSPLSCLEVVLKRNPCRYGDILTELLCNGNRLRKRKNQRARRKCTPVLQSVNWSSNSLLAYPVRIPDRNSLVLCNVELPVTTLEALKIQLKELRAEFPIGKTVLNFGPCPSRHIEKRRAYQKEIFLHLCSPQSLNSTITYF